MNEFVSRASMDNPATERRLHLGPLEVEVMEMVWEFGASKCASSESTDGA